MKTTKEREAYAKAWEEAAELTERLLGEVVAPIAVGLAEVFREKAREWRRQGGGR